MIGSAIISAAAAVYSGTQQKKAADYNAAVATQEAQSIETQTNENIKRTRANNAKILSAQRLNALTSGATLDNSLLSSLSSNAAMLESNVSDIYTQGMTQSYSALNQATMFRQQGRTAQTAGYIKGAGYGAQGVGNALAGNY